MSDTNHIQQIILRYLNGESSDEEETKLQLWVTESSTNEEEFNLIKSIWNDTSNAAWKQVDTEKAWRAVSTHTTLNQTKVVSMFSWKRAITIAASIILILGLLYIFNRPDPIVWNETLALQDNKRIELADGTVVTLRKGSKLSLPENYGSTIRQTRLEGEAYFEVTHNTTLPFSVVTDKSIIRDIGTSFLVQSTDSLEQVTVMEGEVSYTNKKESKLPLNLQAGESAIIKNEMPQQITVDTTNLLSWESKTLVFNNTPLSLVVADLKNFYQVDVEMTENIGQIEITAIFKNESLEQVLKELRLLTNLKFQKNENKLFISK